MSSEKTNRHKVTKINLGGLDFEVITLGNSSQIDVGVLRNGVVPKTLWVDLIFELESSLGTKVDAIGLVPGDLRRPNSQDTIVIFHEPMARSRITTALYTCQDFSPPDYENELA